MAVTLASSSGSIKTLASGLLCSGDASSQSTVHIANGHKVTDMMCHTPYTQIHDIIMTAATAAKNTGASCKVKRSSPPSYASPPLMQTHKMNRTDIRVGFQWCRYPRQSLDKANAQHTNVKQCLYSGQFMWLGV